VTTLPLFIGQRAFRASLSKGRLPTEKTRPPSYRSRHRAGLGRATAQTFGEIRRARLRSRQPEAPAGSSAMSIAEAQEAWLARKRMPGPQGIHSCKNALTCGRESEFVRTVRQSECRTARAKSSAARCRCARRRTCQWKKTRARTARAAWESKRAACAEMRRLQAHERLMTIFVRLFQSVVWSFTRNDHVMHMALTQPCAADANESRLLLQFKN
jgi:hypothetical protein